MNTHLVIAESVAALPIVYHRSTRRGCLQWQAYNGHKGRTVTRAEYDDLCELHNLRSRLAATETATTARAQLLTATDWETYETGAHALAHWRNLAAQGYRTPLLVLSGPIARAALAFVRVERASRPDYFSLFGGPIAFVSGKLYAHAPSLSADTLPGKAAHCLSRVEQWTKEGLTDYAATAATLYALLSSASIVGEYVSQE